MVVHVIKKIFYNEELLPAIFDLIKFKFKKMSAKMSSKHVLRICFIVEDALGSQVNAKNAQSFTCLKRSIITLLILNFQIFL